MRYRSHLRNFSWAGLVLSYVVIFSAGMFCFWFFSQKQAHLVYSSALPGEQKQNKIEALSAQLAFLQQGLNLDQQTLDLVRQENGSLHSQNAALEEENASYKRLLKLTKETQDLALSKFSLNSTENEGEYRYFLTFVQLIGEKTVGGSLVITLIGEENGQPYEYALADLAHVEKGAPTTLKFNNFQVVNGVFQLPKKFLVRSVQVKAEFTQGKKVDIEKLFLWDEVISVSQ